MVHSRYYLPMVSVFFSILVLSTVSGETISDSSDIDIDRYVRIDMEFDEGDRIEIEATITSSRDPVSVYLIKGREDMERFKSTEEVDIRAIKEGKNVSEGNSTFRAINNFSKQNVTSFRESITIAEKDTYHLVIVVHREPGMSKEEIMGLGTRVTYEVIWNEVSDSFPYYLIPVAILIFLIGVGFIIMYFRMDRKDREETEKDDRLHSDMGSYTRPDRVAHTKRRRPTDRTRRR